ncbi:MAG: pilus assembly protein N-terminal domain-containing protein [Myxococcales bacterium]|jgi:Flp pilus assembly secretin CpaC
MRRLPIPAFALLALTVLAPPSALAAGPRPPPGPQFQPATKSQDENFQPKELTPARKKERLPSSIELKVGQKVSYTKVGPCALMDPSLAKMSLSEKQVLTMLALKPGSTKLFVFARGGSDVRQIPVRITR